MSAHWCIECGLPAVIVIGADGCGDFSCWGCGGPVASDVQLAVWNDPAFSQLLEERVRQLAAGEGVRLAGHPGTVFALGAAADLLLLEALGREA